MRQLRVLEGAHDVHQRVHVAQLAEVETLPALALADARGAKDLGDLRIEDVGRTQVEDLGELVVLPDGRAPGPSQLGRAIHDGLLEEILVIGYLLRRLDQLGWAPWQAILTSAVLRGCYHLYQGFGAFIGNAAMGLIFGYLYRRWGRVTPLIIAHTLIDTVTFLGYAALVGLTMTPGTFACGVSINGPSDLASLIESFPP